MASFRLRGSRYWVEYYENGNRIRRPLKTAQGRPVKDKKLAKHLTQEIEDNLNKGESPFLSVYIKPLEALEEYRQYSKTIKTKHTITTSCGYISRYLTTEKLTHLNQIGQDTIKEYLDHRLTSHEINTITANNLIKCLMAFISFCKQKKYLPPSYSPDPIRYPEQTRPPKLFSSEELTRLIEAAHGEALCPAIMTAIYTGMRLGEIRRLGRKDIDFTRETITIQQSKSGQFRVLPMHPALKQTLLEAKLPFDFKNHQKHFKRIRHRAGIVGGWHYLRHTFLSNLIMGGVDLRTASGIAGHSEISTTMIYSHLDQEHQKRAIGKFNITKQEIVPKIVPGIVTKVSSSYSATIG